MSENTRPRRSVRNWDSRRCLDRNVPLTLFLLMVTLSGFGSVGTAFAAPSITLSTSQGSPGSSVTISGAGFVGNASIQVLFDNSVVAATTSTSTGSFSTTFVIPTSTAIGSYVVAATDNIANTALATFTVTSQASIILSPSAGSIGTAITVIGSNFPANRAITLRFDGSAVGTSPSIIVSSNTGSFTASFFIPSTSGGSHTVTATGGARTASTVFSVTFSPAVILSPNSGPSATAVVVTGSGFSANSLMTIRFDSSILTTSIVTTSSGAFSSTVTVPSGATVGSHSITAVDSSGRGASAIFSVPDSPKFTLSTNVANVGSTVSISGSGYSPSRIITIKLDSIMVLTSPTTVITSTSGSFSATFTVPTTASAGSHRIAAIDDSGKAASDIMNVTESNLITLSPSIGASGTDVSVRGSTFTPNTRLSIKFDDISVVTFPPTIFTSTDGAFIAMFDVPTVGSGTHQVTVRDDKGRTATALFTVTGGGPLISLSFQSGTGSNVERGDVVTVRGAGFDHHTLVTITIERGIIPITLATVTTTDTGTFTATVTIPSAASVGVNTIRAVSGDDTAISMINIIPDSGSSIELSSTITRPGSRETISGSAFSPNRSVTVELDDKILATGLTTTSGSFVLTFDIPATIAARTHIVSVSDGFNVASSLIRIMEEQEIVDVRNLDVVNEQGLSVSRPSVGEQVLIESDLKNELSQDQKFVYIVQVKDSQGVTVKISWMSGSLLAGNQFTVAQSWIGEKQDRYNVEVFVWESLSNPVALAPLTETMIRVHD